MIGSAKTGWEGEDGYGRLWVPRVAIPGFDLALALGDGPSHTFKVMLDGTPEEAAAGRMKPTVAQQLATAHALLREALGVLDMTGPDRDEGDGEDMERHLKGLRRRIREFLPPVSSGPRGRE